MPCNRVDLPPAVCSRSLSATCPRTQITLDSSTAAPPEGQHARIDERIARAFSSFAARVLSGRGCRCLHGSVDSRELTLTGPDVIHALIAALGISARHHKCTVPIYCFMPNHLHVILQGTVPDADTWKAMGVFKQRSGY